MIRSLWERDICLVIDTRSTTAPWHHTLLCERARKSSLTLPMIRGKGALWFSVTIMGGTSRCLLVLPCDHVWPRPRIFYGWRETRVKVRISTVRGLWKPPASQSVPETTGKHREFQRRTPKKKKNKWTFTEVIPNRDGNRLVFLDCQMK